MVGQLIFMVLLVVMLGLLIQWGRSLKQERLKSYEQTTPPDGQEWPLFAKTHLQPQAELIRSKLESDGLPVVLEEDRPGSLGLEPPFYYQVKVPVDHIDMARKIIRGTPYEDYLVDEEYHG